VKRRLVVDATGGPLGATIAGANVHDTKLVAATLEAIVVERPPPTAEEPQHLCLDKGDDHPTGHETVAAYQDTPHLRRIGEERLDADGERTYPARRWVVERTLAWLAKCRGLLVRDEKNARHYLGLLQLACALIWIRRWSRLTSD
jgi:putative transposase